MAWPSQVLFHKQKADNTLTPFCRLLLPQSRSKQALKFILDLPLPPAPRHPQTWPWVSFLALRLLLLGAMRRCLPDTVSLLNHDAQAPALGARPPASLSPAPDSSRFCPLSGSHACSAQQPGRTQREFQAPVHHCSVALRAKLKSLGSQQGLAADATCSAPRKGSSLADCLVTLVSLAPEQSHHNGT